MLGKTATRARRDGAVGPANASASFQVKFLYDGQRINADDTPAKLDMEDNDSIDVVIEQVRWDSDQCQALCAILTTRSFLVSRCPTISTGRR